MATATAAINFLLFLRKAIHAFTQISQTFLKVRKDQSEFQFQLIVPSFVGRGRPCF